MPHPTIQRDLWDARRARPAPDGRVGDGIGARETNGSASISALRVQVGHLLIGAGSRLSGERVERVRPSAPQRAV